MLPGLPDKPSFPLNIMADFAGGGMVCVLGILLALFERATKSGKGQVVDVDMVRENKHLRLGLALITGQQVSGARYISLFALVHTGHSSGSQLFSRPRGQNLLDGGAPFYDVYTCSDGRWMSVGCLEPQFFRTFIDHFVKGLGPGFPLQWRPSPEMQANREEWPRLRKFLVDGFQSNTRDHWAKIFHGKQPIMDIAYRAASWLTCGIKARIRALSPFCPPPRRQDCQRRKFRFPSQAYQERIHGR